MDQQMTKPVLAFQTEAGRMYRHPITSEVVPSVTTIISGGVPKPELAEWRLRFAAKKTVAEWEELSGWPPEDRAKAIERYPQFHADQASALGDWVHAAAEQYAKGHDWTIPNDVYCWEKVAAHMRQFGLFLDAYGPVFTHTEVTVWNRSVGYAGTLDWIAQISGLLTLGDTKSGRSVWPDVALQLSAIRNAEFILTLDGTELPMPGIDQSAVLHLRPRSWSLIPVEDGDINGGCFQAALEVFEWRTRHAHKMLGSKFRGRGQAEALGA